MIKLDFYKSSKYEELVSLLKSVNLYDEPWETKENLDLKINKDPQSIIVALEDGKIIGCVFVVVDGWIGMVWRLCVHEQFRHQGLGKRLMAEAESIIKNQGVKEASLFVSTKKDDLHHWYESQGYTKTSDYTFMYKAI